MKGTLHTERDEDDDGANKSHNPGWCEFQRAVQFLFHENVDRTMEVFI